MENENTSIQNQTIEVSIVTYDKSGNKLAEMRIRGNPNTATGETAWFWSVIKNKMRQVGLDQTEKRSFFGLFGGI